MGDERHHELPGGAGNTREGSTLKRLICEHGEVPIDTPRDGWELVAEDRPQAPAAL